MFGIDIWLNQKPGLGAQIDTRHPLASGLIRSVLLNEAGSLAFEMIAGALCTNTIGTWKADAEGLVFDQTIAGDRLTLSPNTPALSKFSIRIRGNYRSNGIGTGYGRFWGIEINTNEMLSSPGNNAHLVVGGTSIYSDVNIDVVAGAIDLIVTCDGANTRTYLNGVLKRADAVVGTLAAGSLTFGNLPDGSRTLNYAHLLAQVWDRALSSAEVDLLYREPYAFLRPVIRRTYFVGATAAQLEAVASASLSVIADLSTAIQMSALATANGDASADLATAIQMAAVSSLNGDLSADLTTDIRLASVASANGDLIADLTTSISLAAVCSGGASATADLTAGSAPLEAVASASGSILADLATAIEMQAAVSASGGISADLSTSIEMSAAVSAHGDASADLTTQIELAAALVASAQSTADLQTAIDFEAIMAANGMLAADLSVGTPAFVASKHRIVAPVEDRAIQAPYEDRTIRAPIENRVIE